MQKTKGESIERTSFKESERKAKHNLDSESWEEALSRGCFKDGQRVD